MEKTYSIGEVAAEFNVSISTLRYYDKENLIPNLQKSPTGIRQFTSKNLETIKIIECLKKSGMPIKDIKIFIQWCEAGDSTLKLRLQMFENLHKTVQTRMAELNETLATLDYKCHYYAQAVKDGTEDYVKER